MDNLKILFLFKKHTKGMIINSILTNNAVKDMIGFNDDINICYYFKLF